MSIVRINSLGITDGTIVNGDINASAAIASTKLTGVNDAKAWINFDGTSTPAIRASFNVTSITDQGTGSFFINFTTAMTDANFSTVIGGSQDNFSVTSNYGMGTYNPSTSGVGVSCRTEANAYADYQQINVAIFR